MMLAAVLACRNESARLYGKPLQYLDVEQRISILDYLVAQLRQRPEIDAVVLAISDRLENDIYEEKARGYGIPFLRGDDRDVLGRLVRGAELVGADHVFRVTTESPFTYFENLPAVLEHHRTNTIDFSSVSDLPDGSYYQIIAHAALRRCWEDGGDAYRNEYCTKYIFDHQDQFQIAQHAPPAAVQRKADIRLTVDWPEDLIVVREIYRGLLLQPNTPVDLGAIIGFLDAHPKMNAVNNWIDSGKGRVWG